MSEKERIQELLYQKEFKKAERILQSKHVLDADLVILNILIQIFYSEETEGIRDTVFSGSKDIDILVKHFIKIKLLLRRLDFDLPKECQDELYHYCMKYNVSRCLLAHILLNNIFNQRKVCRQLIVMFPKHAGYFRKIYQNLEGEGNGRT